MFYKQVLQLRLAVVFCGCVAVVSCKHVLQRCVTFMCLMQMCFAIVLQLSFAIVFCICFAVVFFNCVAIVLQLCLANII